MHCLYTCPYHDMLVVGVGNAITCLDDVRSESLLVLWCQGTNQPLSPESHHMCMHLC